MRIAYPDLTRLMIVFAALLLVGCPGEGPPDTPQKDADLGSDVDGDNEHNHADPEGISRSAWSVIQNISPAEGIDPPRDSTNAYVEDERAIHLGQFIFYEEEISGSGEFSCASCHIPSEGFSDPEPVSVAAGGEENPTGRQSSTLLNIGYDKWFFWDGRRDRLWNQAIAPYEDPIEMDGSRVQLVHYVYDNAEVRQAYEAIFGELPPKEEIDPFPAEGRPIEEPEGERQEMLRDNWESMSDAGQQTINEILVNVMKAVAAFQMQLVSVNSPFDQWVEQVRTHPEEPEKWDAIGEEAQQGAILFTDRAGCNECHSGPMLTDDDFHNVGLPDREWVDSESPGRWEGIQEAKDNEFNAASAFSDDPDGPAASRIEQTPRLERDKGAYKTPTLRNLGKTAPYMNAGQLETLEEVMGFYNEPPEDMPLVGRRAADVRDLNLEPDMNSAVVEFLKTLDGEPVPEKFTEQPDSPVLED